MTPRSILAVTDLSVRADLALSRAALLAVEHDTTLKLLYATPAGVSPRADAACRLAHQALQLGQRHGLCVRPLSQTMNTLEDVASEARCADLVVMGAMPECSLRSLLCGQPVERLLRMARRPILVTRQKAEAPYRRLLVAVDFSDASRKLVEFAFALNQSAQVELFHALSTANEGKLRCAEVSEHAVKAYRHACRRYAQDRMFWLTDSSDARRNRVYSAIGHGDPARQTVVQQQHGGAELIVVGKHPASAVSDFVFGSVARRVLRHATADVLVVPHDVQPASRAAAVRRLDSEPRANRRVRAGAACSSAVNAR
ncbi:universal stress protein [Variovorax sp. PBL-E5]|uniref:universal stress protein n=1 Tax=Variovorax sp. PBL-E5 TaxID=434014 RepID=UPI0013197FAC|nr:universal stress protein [Variovorax sp. PBL-E5]VTU45811.1 universal stress protein UspE [Variovorax sp. PBL-E5]